MRRFLPLYGVLLLLVSGCTQDTFTKEDVFVKLLGNSLDQTAIKILPNENNGYIILSSSEKLLGEVEGEKVVINKAELYFIDENGNESASVMVLPESDTADFFPKDFVIQNSQIFISGYTIDDEIPSMAIVESSISGIQSGLGFREYRKSNAATSANCIFVSSSNEIVLSGYLDTSFYYSGIDSLKRTPYSIAIDELGTFVKDNTGGSGAGLFGEYVKSDGNGTQAAFLIGKEYSLNQNNGSTTNNNMLVEKLDPSDLGLYNSKPTETDREVISKSGFLDLEKDDLLLVGEYDVTSITQGIAFMTMDVSGNNLVEEEIQYLDINRDVTPDGVTSDSEGNIVIVATVEDNSLGKQILVQYINQDGTLNEPLIFGGAGDESAVGVINTSDGGFLVLGTSGFEGNKMINLIKISSEGKIE